MHGVSVTMFDADEDKGKAYVMQTAHMGFFPSAWPDSAQNRSSPRERKERGICKRTAKTGRERKHWGREQQDSWNTFYNSDTSRCWFTAEICPWTCLLLLYGFSFLFQEFQLQSFAATSAFSAKLHMRAVLKTYQTSKTALETTLWEQCYILLL